MESIRHTREHVEQTEGEVIGSRNEALGSLGAQHGIGPPDLMWLRKVRGTENTGFYHWVLGQEVSSAAAVAAYFAELRENVEQHTFLQGLWTSQEYSVVAGTYCCYDALSRVDLRCKVAIPGGVTVEAFSPSSASVPVTSEVWIGAWVSSFLRAEMLDLQTLESLGGLRRKEPLPTLDTEAQFLRCVEKIYQSEKWRGSLRLLHTDAGRGTRAEHWDALCATIYHHFQRRQRLEQACDFFSSLVEWHTEAAIYAALAEHELDLFQEAVQTLEGAVKLCPCSVPLTVALGQRLLEAGQLTRAVSLGQKAVQMDKGARCGWLLLANAYAAGEAYSLALIAANLTPPPPKFPDAKDILGRLPPPAYALTVPLAKLHDPELEELMKEAEEAAIDGNDELLDLPGNVLLPTEPAGFGKELDISQHRIATCVYAAVYAVVVDIVDTVGWDNLLQERGDVFLMSEEISSSDESDEEEDTDAQGRHGPISLAEADSVDGPASIDEAWAAIQRSETSTGRVTVGDPTPPPPGYMPPAAPPPSGAGSSSLPAIIDASNGLSPTSSTATEKAAVQDPQGANPTLWSYIFGGAQPERPAAAAGDVTTSLERLSVSSQQAQPRPSEALSEPRSGSQVSNASVGRPSEPYFEPEDSSDTQSHSESNYTDSGSDSEGDSGSDTEGTNQGALVSDRQWMASGDVSSLLSRKRLCVKWVDELIHAVYKDLAEYVSWQLLDSRLRKAGQRAQGYIGSAADYGEDEVDDEDEDEEEMIDEIPVPVLLPVDWMRRGLMCQRLAKVHDAERALRVVVHGGFNMTAYQALARIYAMQGFATEAVNAMLQILSHHEQIQKFDEHKRIPSSIMWTACTLVMVTGLQHARTAIQQVLGEDHPQEKVFNRLVNECVEWQTDGFDT